MKTKPPTDFDPASIVRDFQKAWEANDLDAAIALMADDAIYTLHISDAIVPYGGEHRGKANIRACFTALLETFEGLLDRSFPVIVDGNNVRGQVEFIYRHRVSYHILSGRYRLLWEIRDGLIVRCDEYHDTARVEAFMRLVKKAD